MNTKLTMVVHAFETAKEVVGELNAMFNQGSGCEGSVILQINTVMSTPQELKKYGLPISHYEVIGRWASGAEFTTEQIAEAMDILNII